MASPVRTGWTISAPPPPAYLAAYSRMQLQKSKVSMSFSALLFGPFYFFYRKAWKPAFGFLAAELLLAAPTFIEMLQLSGSALAPAMSTSALTVFARVCSVLSFVLMLVRGMYGKWLYRKSAATTSAASSPSSPTPGSVRPCSAPREASASARSSSAACS